MPIVFSKIKTDWDAAVAGGFLPDVCTYTIGNDKGVTLIYLPFEFQNVKYHITVNLASGGTAKSFHVTSETPTPEHLIPATGKQKSGTSKTAKNNPSAYYEFSISSNPPNVTFAPTNKVEIIGQKPLTVVSAKFQDHMTNAVWQFMGAFILYMLAQGLGHAYS